MQKGVSADVIFYRRVSSRGSEKTVSGIAALRAVSVQVRGFLTSAESLMPSRTARRITEYAIQIRIAIMSIFSTTHANPKAASVANRSLLCGIGVPPFSGNSATPPKLQSLSRQHANAQQWREIAEFFEPQYIARLRAIGRWTAEPALSVTALAPVREPALSGRRGLAAPAESVQ